MGLIRRHFRQLSAAIAQAAQQPELWPEFLAMLSSVLGSNSIGLHWESGLRSVRRSQLTFSHGLSTSFRDDFDSHYGARNPIIERASRKPLSPGLAVLHQSVCPDEILLRSEFYNDFLRPHDIRHVLGCTLTAHGGETCLLSVCASHGRDQFSEEETHLIELLAPQLQTALLLQRKLEVANNRLLRLDAAVNAIEEGFLLVDSPDGRCLFANAAALQNLALRDGIEIRENCLWLHNVALQQKFGRILKAFELSARAGARSAARGQFLRVRRPSGRADWILQALPVRGSIGTAAVFLDPMVDEDGAQLVDAFDLSPAQQRIAWLLYEGRSIEEIAAELSITRNTVKTHVRRLFTKLDVTGQRELVRLLAKVKRPRT